MAVAAEISLKSLVSQCVDLAQRAGAYIRAVSDRKSEFGSSLATKDKGLGTGNFDPQTVADRQAQRCIVENLRAVYGMSLRVVGEEGELGVEEDGEDVDEIVIGKPKDGLLDEQWQGDDHQLPVDELCVWVDPLDGTKEFTQGRYEYVSTLIGISRQGRPIAGVISEPYGKDAEGQLGRILWGCCLADASGQLPGVHVWGDATWQRPQRPKGRCITVISRSRASGEVADALQRLSEPGTAPREEVRPGPGGYGAPPVDLGPLPLITGTQQVGGAGHKVARVVDGAADLWLFPRAGTSRWDICAAEAMLEASGGALRNRFGDRIFYDPDGTMENTEGVLAAASFGILSAATQVCATLDVARDLEGKPLSRDWLKEALRLSGEVEAFTVTSCVRKKDVCRLTLALRYAGAGPDVPPSCLSFKRSLENSSEPMFWDRCAGRLREAGVRLPEVFYHTSEGLAGGAAGSASSAKYLVLMEDLEGGAFRRCTDSLDDLKLAVAAMARFHGATWADRHFLAKLPQDGSASAQPDEEVALKSWEQMLKSATKEADEANQGSTEDGLAELISRLKGCVAKMRLPEESVCLVQGTFRAGHLVIDDKIGEVIPVNFSGVKVGHHAVDLAALVTSFQAFGSLDELLQVYHQQLPAGPSLADLRKSVQLLCLQLALAVPTDLNFSRSQLMSWLSCLKSLLEELEQPA